MECLTNPRAKEGRQSSTNSVTSTEDKARLRTLWQEFMDAIFFQYPEPDISFVKGNTPKMRKSVAIKMRSDCTVKVYSYNHSLASMKHLKIELEGFIAGRSGGSLEEDTVSDGIAVITRICQTAPLVTAYGDPVTNSSGHFVWAVQLC